MLLKFIFDFLYGLGLVLGSPVFLRWVVSDRRRAGHLCERFGRYSVPAKKGRRIWFLASSVGEVNACRDIVRLMKERMASLEVVITVTTLAGREQAEKSFPDAIVAYNPLDFSGSVDRALATLRPDGIVLMELELWPNFVMAVCSRNIPVGIINGRITDRTARRFHCHGWLFRRLFQRMAFVCAQDNTYAERFLRLGVPADRLIVTGNIKYDFSEEGMPGEASADWLKAPAGSFVLIGGSTHSPEELALMEVYRRLFSGSRAAWLILAPRHLDRLAEVEEVVRRAGGTPRRRTEYRRDRPWTPSPGEVLILDTIGELSRLYGACSAAFIGGTMGPRGGQNLVEAARWGKPLLAGMNFSNFRDAADALEKSGALHAVATVDDLVQKVADLMEHPDEVYRRGAQARATVQPWAGGPARTMRVLEDHFRWLSETRSPVSARSSP